MLPLSFSQSIYEDGIDAFDPQVERSQLEIEALEFDQEQEFSYEDPLLELGGSESINLAQDHLVEEENNDNSFEENN
jgi:hypothetical protein